MEQTQTLQEDLKNVPHVNPQELIASEITAAKEAQRDSFLQLRDDFFRVWEQKALELKPPIIPKHFLEFIPGIPIALPKELEGRGGRVVWSEGMFNRCSPSTRKPSTTSSTTAWGCPIMLNHGYCPSA